MKKYIRPSIEVIAVEGMSHLLDGSAAYNQPGSGQQLAPGQRTYVYIEDDDEEVW